MRLTFATAQRIFETLVVDNRFDTAPYIHGFTDWIFDQKTGITP